jgi:hypothetical protein
MLQVVSEGYTYVTRCCNIPIYLFDLGIQLALIWNVAIHAIYVTSCRAKIRCLSRIV